MAVKSGFIKRLAEDFRTMSNRPTTHPYNVMMGLLSASLLGIVEFVSFFLISEDSVGMRSMFLYTAALMEVLFVVFIVLYRSQFESRSRIWNGILRLYPYIIILVGLAVTSIYQGYSNGIESYLIAVFAVGFIQIYPQRHRVAVFAFGLVAFLALIVFYHGFSSVAIAAMRFGFMINILSYLYATLNFQSHQNRIDMMRSRDDEARKREDGLAELKRLNDELVSSQLVMDAMMLTTTEILKNDRLDDVLQLVLDEAIKLIPAGQAGSILTLENDKMHFRAATGYHLEGLKTITLDRKDLFQSKQENLFEPAIIRDLEIFDAAHLPNDKFEQFKTHGALVAQSILTCSFKSDGVFFGTINIDNFESRDVFGDNDRTMLSQLAKQLEIIISIHNLYEKAMQPIRFDELTQATSRRHHKELAKAAIQKAERDQSTLVLGSIDLNHFKTINDTYGHDVGDECLRAFADGVRANPVDGMVFARVGGDEFTLLLPGFDRQAGERYAARLRTYFDDHPITLGPVPFALRFAIGFGSYPEDGVDLASLMHVADQRMYLDKAASRDISATPR